MTKVSKRKYLDWAGDRECGTEARALKVAKQLGLKNVDSQNDANQMNNECRRQNNPPKPKPKPKPAPKPKPKPKPEPIKHSPEIQQAKERVSSYEKNILSGKTSEDIYGQAQSTVQSSFIKPTSFNFNKQIDFSSNTFEDNQSFKTNEQAQAAQNQMQNFISKYSKYKSSD